MNDSDFKISLQITVYAILFFVAGILAYIYFKIKKPDAHKSTNQNFYFTEAVFAVLVTLAMLLGSMIGIFFFPAFGYDASFGLTDLLPYAAAFLIEAYILLVWLNIVHAKNISNKWKERLYKWTGMFIIFSIFNLINIFFHNPSYLMNPDILREVVVSIPKIFYVPFISAFQIIQHPMEYIESVLKASGGNQFVLVNEYSAWTAILLVFGFSRYALNGVTNNQ